MEREIANVAAACAMRGFRYLAFPPIVFESPLEPLPAPEMEQGGEMMAPLVEIGAAMPAEAPPLVVAAAAEPAEVVSGVEALPVYPPPVPAPPPSPPPERSQVIAMPEGPPPPGRAAPPPRRFALLADVSAEIRRQAGP